MNLRGALLFELMQLDTCIHCYAPLTTSVGKAVPIWKRRALGASDLTVFARYPPTVGRTTRTLKPPPMRLVAVARPPSASTLRLTIQSPSPA